MNYADYILYENSYDPDHVVSFFNKESYTLTDYRKKTDEIMAFFEKEGFSRNRSAMIVLNDSPACIALYLACIRYGIVPVLTTPLTMESVLRQGIRTADATYLFSSEEQDFSAFSDQVFLVTMTWGLKNDPFRLTLKNPDAAIPARHVDSEESAYFLMTSGSSGVPKIVMHSHPAFPDTNRNYAADTLGINEKDAIFSIAKMYFGYGLANNLFFSLLNGAPAWLDEEPFTPEQLFAALEDFHPTVFFGIPSAYRMLMDYLDQHPQEVKKLGSIRLYISSGEPMDETTSREWKKITGKYISNNMGSSECSAILFDPGREDTLGSAGWPVKGTSVRLEGPDGGDSDTGVLYFTSRGNFTGYRNNPEANKDVIIDGWFRTGDVFRRDEKGCYWGLGREDNMMKYHGMWVSPAEVEKKILEFGGIRQAAVFKMTAGRHDLLAASVIPETDFEGIAKLKEFLNSEIELYKVPETFDLLESFPVNNNGKIDYPALKKRIENMFQEEK